MLGYSDKRRSNTKQCKKYKHLILSIIGMYLLIAAFCIYLSNINHEPEPNHSLSTTRQPLMFKDRFKSFVTAVGISIAPKNSKQTLVRGKRATIDTILSEIAEFENMHTGTSFDDDIHKIRIYNNKGEPVPYYSIPKNQPISQLNLLSSKDKLRYKILYKISINLQAENHPESIYIDPDEKLGTIVGITDVSIYGQQGQRLDPSKSAKENGITDGYATIWLYNIPIRVVDKNEPHKVVADIMISPNFGIMALKDKIHELYKRTDTKYAIPTADMILSVEKSEKGEQQVLDDGQTISEAGLIPNSVVCWEATDISSTRSSFGLTSPSQSSNSVSSPISSIVL